MLLQSGQHPGVYPFELLAVTPVVDTGSVNASAPTVVGVTWETVAPLVIWDGDDTLWFVEPLYDAARSTVAEFVAGLGLDASKWETVQRATDVRNIETMGLSRQRFPTSCVQAFEHLAFLQSVPVSPEQREAIRRLACQVFDRSAPLAEGVVEALEAMARFARMALITKGDPSVQIDRIARSDLARHFCAVLIVPDKNVDTFGSVLRMLDADPMSSWSIGNSLPSDINPALRLGMSAVWIDAHVWEHERRETEVGTGSMFNAATVKEAAEVVREHIPSQQPE